MTDPTLYRAGTSFELNQSITETKLADPALIVLLSHNQHFDNLDANGCELLKV